MILCMYASKSFIELFLVSRGISFPSAIDFLLALSSHNRAAWSCTVVCFFRNASISIEKQNTEIRQNCELGFEDVCQHIGCEA